MASMYMPKHAAPDKRETPRAMARLRKQYKRLGAAPQPPSRPIPTLGHRRNKRGKRILSVVLTALIFVFILAGVKLFHSLRRDELKGTWTLDETTVYEFDGKDHGTLHLPLESYDFSYTIEDGFLTIDFADETATDAGYRYTRSGSALTLDTNTGMVYRFHEQKR